MSRHLIDRPGVNVAVVAQTLGADTAEPTPHQDGDDPSVSYVRFLDSSGAEVDLDDARVQQAVEDYTPPAEADPDGALAVRIQAVHDDPQVSASVKKLAAALLGINGAAAVAGRPTGR